MIEVSIGLVTMSAMGSLLCYCVFDGFPRHSDKWRMFLSMHSRNFLVALLSLTAVALLLSSFFSNKPEQSKPSNSETLFTEKEDPSIGLSFDSRDYFAAPGYSGRAIEVKISVNEQGTWQSLELGKHYEPIFLNVEGRQRLQAFLDQYLGLSVKDKISVTGASKALSFEATVNSKEVVFDGISSATITVRALHRSIVKGTAAALRDKATGALTRPSSEADLKIFHALSINQLRQAGWLLRWQVSREQAEATLGRSLGDYKYQRYDLAKPGEFIDLWAVWLNPPSLGTSVLGTAVYQRLMEALFEPDKGTHKNAFLLASSGLHTHFISELGAERALSRLSLHQGANRFGFKELYLPVQMSEIAPPIAGAAFTQILTLGDNEAYDPSLPADLRLSMRRNGKYMISDVSYFDAELPVIPELLRATSPLPEPTDTMDWREIWAAEKGVIETLLAALIVLSLFFACQRQLLHYSRGVRRFRLGFLVFTLFFVGYYAQGQLSVTNIYTLILAIRGDISWSFFLTDPVMFILWSYVFLSLFLWGRGLYCGWLCPFGVLQEFASIFGKRFNFKQWSINELIHRRLQWLKYFLLLILVLMSIFASEAATLLSEIEPFKTAITQNFVRGIPYVVYAIALLVLSTVLHKPFCRYLCPLGAGLAIIGTLRRFSFLDRRTECGNPCQLCRKKCEIGAITISGEVDYNECVQCMECVVILRSPSECAVLMLASKRAG